MKFKTTTLVTLLTASSLMMATNAFATTFKVAVGDSQGSAQWEMASKFKASFEAKTGGKHKADLFPNEQLGGEETTVNSAAMGTLDFSVLAINNVTPFSPTVGVLTLPYVIQSAAEAKKLVTGEVGKELTANTVRDAGVRIVGWTFTGFRVLTNSKKPVKTLADLKELKIRVPKNEIDRFLPSLGHQPHAHGLGRDLHGLATARGRWPRQSLHHRQRDEVQRSSKIHHEHPLCVLVGAHHRG